MRQEARQLEGRVAVVTGAARMHGIGRATALLLATRGAAVVVSGAPRDPATFPDHEKAAGWQGTASIAAEIIEAGGQAVACACDVRDSLQIEALLDETERAFGVADAIVNNAGLTGNAGSAPLLDIDQASWRQTMDVNIDGVFNMCRAAGRRMRAAGKAGAIVNVSSVAGRVGMANYGAYCASKFGVIGLTQQLAVELSQLGIRVNCVCPGSVVTDMSEAAIRRLADGIDNSAIDNIKRAVIQSIPLGRQGRTVEQATVIAFLLSDEASYVTGQSLNVDGGLRMD